MLNKIWLNFATLFLNFKECFVKNNKSQSNEEVIADLHTYLEHLNEKSQTLDMRILKCNQKAVSHKALGNKENTKFGREREFNRAKIYLKDKRRLQQEQDKIMKFSHLIHQQIDSLSTSELDSIMVDAMRQYNMTATQMGLPDRTREIEDLGNDLEKRFSEATEFQQILGDATNPLAVFSANDSDDDLALELDALMGDEKPVYTPSVAIEVEKEVEKEDEIDHEENQSSKRICVSA